MRQGTPHTPCVFEVTSLNHNKVQRQGAHVSLEAASVTTKDRHRRPRSPWLWRCCDQAAPHCSAAPPVIYLLHRILLILFYFTSSPLSPNRYHQQSPFTLSQQSCVQLKDQVTRQLPLTSTSKFQLPALNPQFT